MYPTARSNGSIISPDHRARSSGDLCRRLHTRVNIYTPAKRRAIGTTRARVNAYDPAKRRAGDSGERARHSVDTARFRI